MQIACLPYNSHFCLIRFFNNNNKINLKELPLCCLKRASIKTVFKSKKHFEAFSFNLLSVLRKHSLEGLIWKGLSSPLIHCCCPDCSAQLCSLYMHHWCEINFGCRCNGLAATFSPHKTLLLRPLRRPGCQSMPGKEKPMKNMSGALSRLVQIQDYSTTLLLLCGEICHLAHHLHEAFSTFYNKIFNNSTKHEAGITLKCNDKNRSCW